ncbi:MAG: hypothetical protein ABSF38_20105 [Verrucomicrobiota bacterium]|jgi:hypothetical protein
MDLSCLPVPDGPPPENPARPAILPLPGPVAAPAAIMGGRNGVANFINTHFQGRLNTRSGLVNQMSISRWLRGQFLPGPCREFFPPPDGAGRFSVAAVSAWVDKYLLAAPSPSASAAPLPQEFAPAPDIPDTDEEIKREKLRRLKLENDLYEQETDRKYVLFADSVTAIQQFAVSIRHDVIELVQRQLPADLLDLVDRGLSPTEILEAMRPIWPNRLDELFARFQSYANSHLPAEPPPDPRALHSPAHRPQPINLNPPSVS